jgi:hypothetical protein
MPITVRILSMVFAPMGILRCRRYWWWHLLAIQKSLALLEILSYDAMDLAPVFSIIGMLEGPLLLLLWGLLAVISVVSSVLMISPIGCVDLPIILLPWRPLAPGFQKSSLGFRSLYAHIGDYEQINHLLGLFHGDLLHSLNITDPILKGVDDLNVLNIRDSIPSVVETFHIVLETLIMFLPDDLQGLYCMCLGSS